MANLGCFFRKNGLGPLGVKVYLNDKNVF
jgi:hypothetical protein